MLLIDVGNTKTAFAWSDKNKILKTWKISTHAARLKDEYVSFLNQAFAEENIEKLNNKTPVVLCSVVPEVTAELSHLSKNVFVLKPGVKTSFDLNVERPETLGADRLADMEAALSLFEPPLIVVDFGTATTISVLDEQEKFLGGLICPGFGISAQALFKRAAALSAVYYKKTDSIIGNNTRNALSNGVCKGHASMVESLVDQICQEKKWQNSNVVVTGGALQTLNPYLSKDFHRMDTLALTGLHLLGKQHFFGN